MKFRLASITSPLLLAALALTAAPAGDSSLPNETLRYSINWPSGLSLGEATLSASSSEQVAGQPQPPHMNLKLDLDAGVPGFPVSDRFRADASGKFCSAEFEKNTSHGAKKVDDRETFDPATGTVTRGSGDGQSQILANACGKDALTFLYYLRQELSQGRVPPKQTVFFGAPYEIKLQSQGTESVKIANKPVEAEHLKASVDGPSSSISFDLFFLQDKARTLALVRVPLALGTFSMELVR
ncbi:MAG TPA: DUF3108 domain-containing protein [Bryobacteraceae bacterium]|nr:DUF3108 domain-containing protein [Bryobacteraceae bacterium]